MQNGILIYQLYQLLPIIVEYAPIDNKLYIIYYQ